jgi:hypothetical protein
MVRFLRARLHTILGQGKMASVLTPPLALSTSNWIYLAGVIISGLAFVGVIVSLLLLRAQGLAARDATLVIAYQNMTAQMADMDRFFLEHLDLRPYFFGGKEPPNARDEHDRVLAVAEMYVNLMDNVLTQSPALNRDGIAADWEAYFRGVYETSPVVREFWAEHGSEWFANSPLATLYPTPPS